LRDADGQLKHNNFLKNQIENFQIPIFWKI